MRPVSKVCLLSFICTLFVSGCGQSGPPLGFVAGTVKLDGKPVPGALVTFISKEADGSSSYGKTDANGKYQLEFSTDRFGVMLGNHDVVITTRSVIISGPLLGNWRRYSEFSSLRRSNLNRNSPDHLRQ